ncbi:type IV pilus twitching motility protein PilT [Micavibrio aeruginosavorus]|uniref:Twitching motility protein PilT n=1 Tax=Micavibrio aeruginosavorus (strain ARL-13) TaxID=856793 RepID=G2KPN5_MICAA|nr:type IV pilus twitching motility protein PilT [Micavibrio aeruginosavorus]AEP09854.1 twitching motility protein PilT [Micavibrio aeruginosavorus ARL-13]
MDILQLLRFTIQNNASDLHLSPTNPPVIRVNGEMKRIKADPLQSDDIRTMLYSVMNEDQRADFERELELDFAIAYGEKARFRVNAFTTRNGTAAVFRSIPSLIPTMEELELPPIIRRFAELEKGLVLVTGPTGSGKSTTLASIINYINENHASHIITVEDPVEFFHASKKSVVNHREIGTDTKSFSKALRSSLREDPDVILVGEMRDYETISLALTAAETGHLVFGTLHSNTAAKTIDRIIDVFPSGDKEMVRAMLASSLQGVVAQSLLKRADGSGRVGAFEILVGTNAVRNLIRENQIAQLYSMIQTGSRYGMTTLEDSVNALLEQGVIDKDEARRALLKTTEDEGARDEDSVAASLGGGKMSETLTRKQAAVGRALGAQPRKSGEDDSGEGYTF